MPIRSNPMSWARHHLYVSEPGTRLQDLVLVDRCKDGEDAAARELFKREQRRVQATLYRVLGSNRDMEDLMQDTFVQVFRSLPSFRGDAKLSTWIDRITVRVAYRYIARKKPAALTTELSEHLMSTNRVEPSLDRRVVAREGIRRLYAVLAELSPAARVAFALHEIDGRSVAEVAECVEASVTATKLRIWRARRALHKRAARDPVLSQFLDADSDADAHGDAEARS